MAPSQDSWQLIRAYVDDGDEAAFAQIVRQYVDLVYSAALRQVRDRAMAEDVCQGVFLLLSAKAAGLRSNVILPAYLLKATYFISRNAIKRETRRRIHERKAAAMSAGTTLNPPSDIAQTFSGMLDEGMNHLNERDRTAIVLRYFEQRSLAEAGAALGVSEDAAAMRVSRALAKLRRFFETRKLTLNSVEAGAILTAVAVRKAPPGLADSAVQSVLSGDALSPVFGVSELVDGATDAMKYQELKSTLCCAASVAAVMLILVGVIWHLAFNAVRQLPPPPAEVWQ